MVEDTVAPSPIVPTSRHRDYPGRGKAYFAMTSVIVDEIQALPRIKALRRHHPRSAGASSRPMRSENILELIRFFQMPGDSGRTEGTLEMFKAGHRRLRQIGQEKSDRKFKGPFAVMPSPGKVDNNKQLVTSLEESEDPTTQIEPTELDRRPSRARRDVEAIGRPWLDDTVERRHDDRYPKHNRSGSFGLGDLAALVDFSVSFPEYGNDGEPPPYQERQVNRQNSPVTLNPVGNISHAQGIATWQPKEPVIPTQPLANEVSSPQSGSGDETEKQASSSTSSILEVSSASATYIALATSVPSRTKLTERTLSPTINRNANDAKSLAILLQATEKLERERIAVSAEIEKGGVSTLHKGVTDTPFTANSSSYECNCNNISKNPDLEKTDQSFTGSTSFPKAPTRSSSGPIPLKLVTECLPRPPSSTNSPSSVHYSRTRVMQISSLESPTPLSNNSRSSQDEAQTKGVAGFSRSQALLAPLATQSGGSLTSRQVRSVTPDSRPAFMRPSKTEQRKQLRYVMPITSAPKPAPSKPLPSIPGSNKQRIVQGTTLVNLPLTKASALAGPVCNQESSLSENPSWRLDSPTLGSSDSVEAENSGDSQSNVHLNSPPGRSHGIATPPLSQISSSSISETIEQLRLARTEKVHALRLRDIGSARNSIHNKGDMSECEKMPKAQKVVSDTRLPRARVAVDQKLPESKKSEDTTNASPPNPFPVPLINSGVRTPSPWVRRCSSVSELPLLLDKYEEPARCSSVQSLKGSDRIYEKKRSSGVRSVSEALLQKSASSGNYSSDDEDLYRPMSRQFCGCNFHAPHFCTNGPNSKFSRQKYRHAPNLEGESESSNIVKERRFYQNSQQSPRELAIPPELIPDATLHRCLRSLQSLERRVTLLERQNKILQSALFTALKADSCCAVDHPYVKPKDADMSMGSPSSADSLTGLGSSSSCNIGSSHSRTHPRSKRWFIYGHDHPSEGCFSVHDRIFSTHEYLENKYLRDLTSRDESPSNLEDNPNLTPKSRDSGYEWELASSQH